MWTWRHLGFTQIQCPILVISSVINYQRSIICYKIRYSTVNTSRGLARRGQPWQWIQNPVECTDHQHRNLLKLHTVVKMTCFTVISGWMWAEHVCPAAIKWLHAMLSVYGSNGDDVIKCEEHSLIRFLNHQRPDFKLMRPLCATVHLN